MSSQSFDRADEYDSDVIGGNLSEARGIDRDVAFFRREPRIDPLAFADKCITSSTHLEITQTTLNRVRQTYTVDYGPLRQ